jgi:CheY-specific phosphatase CheX
MPDNPVRAEIDEVLGPSVARVLETMCYVAVLGQANAPDQQEGCISVRVRFEGRSPGSLAVCIPRRMAETLAEDFLGARPEQALAALTVEDVVSELGNMICGAVLSEIQRDARFKLFPPQVLAEDEAAAERAAAQWFGVGEGVLGLTLTLGPAPAA